MADTTVLKFCNILSNNLLYIAGQVLHAVQEELYWVNSIAGEISLSRKGGNCNSLLQSSSCFAAFESRRSRSRCDMWHVTGALDSRFTIRRFRDRLHAEAIRWEHRAPGRSSSDVRISLPLRNMHKMWVSNDVFWAPTNFRPRLLMLNPLPGALQSVGPLWRSQRFLKQKLRPKGPWDEFFAGGNLKQEQYQWYTVH